MTFWLIEGAVILIGSLGVWAVTKAVNSDWDSPKKPGKHRKN